MEFAKIILTKFTDETILLFSGTMLFVFICLIALWLYERKKFKDITRQIPTSVVNAYLESIIQNSRALKSSLTGAQGPESLGVPSVYPIGQLGVPLTAGPQSLNAHTPEGAEFQSQKDAEIAYLKTQLSEKDSNIRILSKKIQDIEEGTNLTSSINEDSLEEITILKEEIALLQEKLKSTSLIAPVANNDTPGTAKEGNSSDFDALKKEKEGLELRLKEYSIIAEDLANLKKFQTENTSLKEELQQLKVQFDLPLENETSVKIAEGPQENPQPELVSQAEIETDAKPISQVESAPQEMSIEKAEDVASVSVQEESIPQEEIQEKTEEVVAAEEEKTGEKEEEVIAQEVAPTQDIQIVPETPEKSSIIELSTVREGAPTLDDNDSSRPQEAEIEGPINLDEIKDEAQEEDKQAIAKDSGPDEDELIKEFEKMIG